MRGSNETRVVTFVVALVFVAIAATTPTHAKRSYYFKHCASCHVGTYYSGSPEDSPTCAGCHYHGMYASGRRQEYNFRGWTDKSSYAAGEMMSVYVTGGNQPGWVRVRVEDEDGQEVARATGPTGMGDDGDPNWTASRLPGPIVLRVRAPYVPGTHDWKVAWFGNTYEPNPPVPAEHMYLRWHGVSLPPFEVYSSDRIGPKVSSVTVSPAPTGGVRQIVVTALASDAGSGMTPIGEVRAGIMPALEGQRDAWVPLDPVDGLFDRPDELVKGALDVSALPEGPWSLIFQASDLMGNWGSFESVAFEVTNPPPGDAWPPLAVCGAIYPAVVPPGQAVQLRARIDDGRSGGSPIYGAEAFLGAPGQDGAGIVLLPYDGALDGSSEEVRAQLSTSGLAEGTYSVAIHGLDAAGVWGSYCLASFEVLRSADTTGPAVTDAYFAPAPTSGSQVAVLYASLSDAGTGNGAVTAGEWYVGAAPPAGEGIPMQADDGAFDSPTERLTGAIDVTGWKPGAYVVGVRGKDAMDHWGPDTLVSLEVTTGGPDQQGPKFTWLQAVPHHTAGARFVTLRGKVDDLSTGGSRPVLVDYFLGRKGLLGGGVHVRPKGKGPLARFRAAVKVTALSPGSTYTVYARAMDEHGNWGPMAVSAFVVTSKKEGHP